MLKHLFSKYLVRAHKDEEVIVAKAGKPRARLVPLENLPERIPGRYQDGPDPSFFEPLPDEDLKAWEH